MQQISIIISGPGSVFGIAAGNGLDGPGIEPRWRRDFSHLSRPVLGYPPTLLYNGYRVFSVGKVRPGREFGPSPHSSAVVKKEYSCTSTLLISRTACAKPQCLYKGALYLYLYHLQQTSTDKFAFEIWDWPSNEGGSTAFGWTEFGGTT